MKNTNYMLIIFLILILNNVMCLKDFEILLDRTQLHSWIKNDTVNSNSICFRPKTSTTIPFSSDIKYPKNCTKNIMNRIIQQCVFKNLAYTIPVKLNDKTLDLMLDLFSPWSWIKSNDCQTCKRDGEDCSDNCSTNNNQNTKTFQCIGKCTLKPRCGEIDLFAEGLSISGQWIQTSMNIGKQIKIRQQKILYALQLSGQQFLQADGVLGLAQEYEEMNEDEEDEEESMIEQGSGLLTSIQNKYRQASNRIFSIYLGEVGRESIQFGDLDEKKIYQIKQHPITYSSCIQNEQQNDDYFKWKIKIDSLELYKFTDETNIVQQEDLDSISDFNEIALISLSTTALVLPQSKLSQLLLIFQTKHNLTCSANKKYLYFVQCSDLPTQFDFKNLAIKLLINPGIPLYINPQDLIQSCTQSGTKKDCLLNLQQSYDDVTIIGESALKNTYLIFDMDKKQIGFAPALNRFNENIIQRIEQLIISAQINIADEIQFVMRFYFVIIILAAGLAALRNFACVAWWVGEMKVKCGRMWGLIVFVVSRIFGTIFGVFGVKNIQNKEMELTDHKQDDTNYQYNVNELGYSDIEHDEN